MPVEGLELDDVAGLVVLALLLLVVLVAPLVMLLLLLLLLLELLLPEDPLTEVMLLALEDEETGVAAAWTLEGVAAAGVGSGVFLRSPSEKVRLGPSSFFLFLVDDSL